MAKELANSLLFHAVFVRCEEKFTLCTLRKCTPACNNILIISTHTHIESGRTEIQIFRQELKR